jgi:catechol 2,3-dioxygenase-like lactoylglutathione lyase family enzyme
MAIAVASQSPPRQDRAMEFAGFGHVCLVVNRFDECVAFYDRVLGHIGMKPYVSMPRVFRGWFADEYMFVITNSASQDDRFSQFRIGLHHLSFRARNRADVDSFGAILNEIDAKIVHPAEQGAFWPGYYSVLCEDPAGNRIEINYIPKEGWAAVNAASDVLIAREIS